MMNKSIVGGMKTFFETALDSLDEQTKLLQSIELNIRRRGMLSSMKGGILPAIVGILPSTG